MELILASASPRRRALLEQIGLTFKVIPSQVSEPPFRGGSVAEYARSLALEKARDVSNDHPRSLVIGADTIVVIDDQVLGKPKDAAEAGEMLGRLSNRWHQVITAYALINLKQGIQVVRHVATNVHFRDLEDRDVACYIQTGAPFDKAGAYGIQDQSAIFVNEIRGCFYNVVGFPVSDFYDQLKHLLQEHHLSLTPCVQ